MRSSTLQTVSVVIAAISVVIGVTSWRRSLLGQRRFELAEQACELFAQVSDAFSQIRSPFSYSGEGSTRTRRENETEEESGILDQAFVAIERYNSHSELFAKLLSLRHRFALYFGDEEAKPFEEVDKIRQEILKASRLLSHLWLRQGRVEMKPDEFEQHLDQMHQAEAVFWEGFKEADPIVPRVEKMVEDINRTCRQIVDPRPNFWTYIYDGQKWLVHFLKSGK